MFLHDIANSSKCCQIFLLKKNTFLLRFFLFLKFLRKFRGNKIFVIFLNLLVLVLISAPMDCSSLRVSSESHAELSPIVFGSVLSVIVSTSIDSITGWSKLFICFGFELSTFFSIASHPELSTELSTGGFCGFSVEANPGFPGLIPLVSGKLLHVGLVVDGGVCGRSGGVWGRGSNAGWRNLTSPVFAGALFAGG